MCKILCVAGLNPKNHKANWTFVQEMLDVMTVGNDDGCGYAAIVDNKLFAERWVYNKEAFRVRINHKPEVPKIIEDHKDIIQGNIEHEGPKYNNYGNVTKKAWQEATCIMLHARKASGTVNIRNTHPFIDNDTNIALIHNGVISNVEEKDHIRSTCDSERILNKYLEHEVYKDPRDMTDMCQELQGWMACGVLHNTNGWKMDLWRSDTQNLYGVYIPGLEVIAYGSSDVDIIKTAKDLGYSNLTKFQLKENLLIRLDCNTGKILDKQTFQGIIRKTTTTTYYQGYNNAYNNHHTNNNYSNTQRTLLSKEKNEESDSWFAKRIGYHV